jgi:hypothetical protein
MRRVLLDQVREDWGDRRVEEHHPPIACLFP